MKIEETKKEANPILTTDDFESLFNQGFALMQLAKPAEAMRKFKKLCQAVEYQYQNGHMSNEDLYYVPYALSKMAEIYHERPDLHKALLHMKTARLFIEYLHPEKRVEDPENDEPNPPRDVPALFERMHVCFDTMDSPTLPDSNEVIRKFLDSKRIHDEKVAENSMKEIQEAINRKNEQEKLSTFEKVKNYFYTNPQILIYIAIGLFIYFISFFLIMYMLKSVKKNIENVRMQNKAHHEKFDRENNVYESKEGFEEEERQFQEMLKTYQQLPHGNTKELLQKLRQQVNNLKKIQEKNEKENDL